MTGSYSITTVNRSSVAWNRYYWTAPSDIAFTINTQPNDKLLGGNGQEILAWDQAVKFLGAGGTEGYADGQVIWQAPNGKCFGIQIHIPVQLFGMGTSPYYQVKTVQDGGWDGEHRSDPYNFSKDIGFDITVKAVADHASMHVTATINDLAS
ncbi:hypothetical protein ACSS6W_007739 [Trichoderma asperelloides]|uniref:Uncharacterized protein n=1 Tax=Trichoderma asperellum TaxID=101201 RepID=A0A6V8R1Z0_TRIAP|nr:hypothetical protein LI328DRAFT_124628 [Trichoderma asperelloides]GFP59084.1 hypothetical protein TASIC1_0012008700 [Trichoderma asperellum]